MGSANIKTIAARRPRGECMLVLDLPWLSIIVVGWFVCGRFVNISCTPSLVEEPARRSCRVVCDVRRTNEEPRHEAPGSSQRPPSQALERYAGATGVALL